MTLDRVIRHTVVFHLSTSTYIPNFIGIEKTFCGRTDGRTSETHFIRSTLRSRPKNNVKLYKFNTITTLQLHTIIFRVQHSQINGTHKHRPTELVKRLYTKSNLKLLSAEITTSTRQFNGHLSWRTWISWFPLPLPLQSSIHPV